MQEVVQLPDIAVVPLLYKTWNYRATTARYRTANPRGITLDAVVGANIMNNFVFGKLFCRHELIASSISATCSYFSGRVVGKSGFILFHGSSYQTISVESVAHPKKEASRLVWFVVLLQFVLRFPIQILFKYHMVLLATTN